MKSEGYVWFIEPQILGELQSILQQKARLKDKTPMDFNLHVEGGESEIFWQVCPLRTPDGDFVTTAQDTDPETTSLGFSAWGSE